MAASALSLAAGATRSVILRGNLMRRALLLLLCAWVLTSCGAPPTEIPTPLPTAVPPAEDRSQQTGTWAVSFRYDFPPGTFGLSEHRYAFLAQCPVVSGEDITSDWHYFEVTDEVLPQPEPLYLRLHGLSADAFNPSAIANDQIHPDRPIVAIMHLVGLTQHVAEMASESCEAVILWDDVGRAILIPGEPFQP